MPAPSAAIDWEALSLRLVFGLLTFVAMIFLVAPTLIVLLTSFTASESLRFPPPAYSLRWYYALMDADQMQRASCLRIRRSLRFAATARATCDSAGVSSIRASRTSCAATKGHTTGTSSHT